MADKAPHPAVTALAAKAFTHGIFMTEALNRAQPKVAGSTWTRMKQGSPRPFQDTIARIDAALDQIIAERTQASASQEGN